MMIVDGVEMVDVREAADLAGRNAETVRRWVWTGRLLARRQGNRLLIARDDLERLLGRVHDDRPTTLAEWAADAARSRGPAQRRKSARDLVLADRAGRES